MAEPDARDLASITISGDPRLLEEVQRALDEVFSRLDLSERPRLERGGVEHWEQSGGWYLDVEDPWSQSGGWVLDLEGAVSRRPARPHEALVRDVWAALDRVKPDPDWQQAWGPLPRPEPGPLPGPEGAA